MARLDPCEFMTSNGLLVTFRSVLPREAKDIARLMQRTYAESPYLATRADEFDANPRRISSWIESHLASPGRLMVVAEYKSTLVGLIDFTSSSKQRLRHVGEFGISVIQDWQHRGIGRALLQTLITWARSSAVIEKIELQVFAENRNAIALYQSLGFHEEGRKIQAIKCVTGDDRLAETNKYMDLMLMGLFVRNARF